MEENMERNENELQAEPQKEVNQEVIPEEPKAPEAPASPKKPPMNKKAMIGIIIGAVAVIAIVIALVLGLGGNDNSEHTCSFGEWTVVAEADCTRDGSKERVCSCGEKESQVIPATGHDWKAATCQSPKMCNKCHTIEGGTAAHTYTENIAIPDALKSNASCTAVAVYYKSCICGKISENAEDTFTSGTTTAHNYVNVSSTAADCENAATETYACSCGSEYTDTIGTALGHSISGATPVERPVEGSSCEHVWIYTCGECGDEIEGEHVFYHNYIATITTHPTCKDNGEKTLTCSCGDSYTEAIEKNSTGHKWVKGEVNDGVRVDECEICSETKNVTVYEGTTTDSINSGDLKDTEIELNDANISLDDGVVDTIGDKSVTISAEKLGNDDMNGLLSPEQLAQVGDSPIYNFTINDGTDNISKFGENNFVTITLPYTLQEGEDVDSIAIWFIDDNGELESIKATYNNGYVTFKTNHFSYYTVTRLTPAERCALYGHSYAEQVFAGSCTEDGYILKVCVRCHDSEKTITSVAQGHDFKTDVHKATCTENGYTLYSCKNCNFSYSKTEIAIGHIWEAGAKEESTCTKNGYETFECKNCDQSYTKTLPKLDHQMVEEKIIKEATCSEDGSKVILCVCGESVYVDIPATGDHSYENGVCKHCGQASSAAVKLDGIVIRVENLTYSMSEKEDKDDNWTLTGSIKQVDIAELMVYVEDGQLHGAAIGSVDYYDKWNDSTNTYALTAIIDNGYLYYHVDNIKGAFKQDMEGRMSLEELVYESIFPNEETANGIISFVTDTLIPSIEILADNNSELIDEVIDDALSILFTTTTEADGSRVISLDHAKLVALNENLATLSVAEVIEHYFGEGVVDEIYNATLDAFNTVITDIPGIFTEQGIDMDKLLDEYENFCKMTGFPVDIDFRDVLYGEDYADVTIGMLIFGTEDKSYDKQIKSVFDLIREKTLYELISPEKHDDVKKTVDGVIELIAEKIGLSFTVNSAGQLVDIDLDVIELTVELEEQSHFVNMSVDLSFTGRIDVSWDDIIGEINGNIFMPDDEKLDKETHTNQYNTSGEMTYKGERYYFDGQNYCSYTADYNRLIAYSSESNCGDFRRYDLTFATVGYEVSVRRLKTEYKSNEVLYTILIDESTNETVELEIKQNGATAIYADGSTKELTSDDFASLEKLYKAVFGGESHDDFYREKYLSFYYNEKTKEYAETSPHNYKVEHELRGESCEEGVVSTYTCLNCGDSYSNNYDYHRTTNETIDLTEYGACSGSIEISNCACGEEFSIYFDWETCGHSSYNEYYDDYGRLVSVEARSCTECGLRAEKSYYTVDADGICQQTAYYNVVVSVGDTLVINEKYENTYVSHDYTAVGTLKPGAESCEDGAIITYTCKDCGDSYTKETSWHHNYLRETIDLAALGSVCGGYAEVMGCACGYNTEVSLEHSLCDFNHEYCSIWIDNVIDESQYTADGYNWYGHSSYIYVCAVTNPESCPFKIRYAEYWLYDGDCTASRYRIWQFGYNKETGTYKDEIKIKVESRVYHNYNVTELPNGVRFDCPDCGSYYSEINYYDANGNNTKYEHIAVNTLDVGNKYYESIREYERDSDGKIISERSRSKTIYRDGRVSEEINEDITINGYEYTVYSYHSDGSYWYRYDYTYDFTNGCNSTCTYTNSNGEHRVTSENCCKYYWTTIENPTCSQDGLEGEYCPVCQTRHDTYTINPTDHNWVYITEGHYYCFRCGLENSNGISGKVVLEDLSYQYGNDTNYVVGYYTYNNISFTYYVSLILNDGTEIILDGIDFTKSDEPRAIIFSKADVENALASKGYSFSDGDVRFAFVPSGSDGSFDYAITFTETVNIDNIVDDVSFVEYVGTGETVSFTICPNQSGYWSFTSMAGSDTYGYLYDADGNMLEYNDDGGYDSNFRIEYYLEAGVTYTVSVRWYSSDNEGSMPLLFTFAG